MAPASRAKIAERKSGGSALPGCGSGAGQDPDRSQAIVIRIVVAQRIAQHGQEGDVEILRTGRPGTIKPCEYGDELGSTGDRLGHRTIFRNWPAQNPGPKNPTH